MAYLDRRLLMAEAEHLERRLEAIRVLLQDDRSDGIRNTSTQRRRRARSKKGTKRRRDGLRPSIRRVLAAHPAGLKPIQVTAILEGEGMKATGKVRFSTRVSGEMYRMSRGPHASLRHTKGGKYKVK